MALTQKFLFNVSFDEPDPPHVGPGATEPRFGRADLDKARAEGLAQGQTAALAEAVELAETRAARALEAIERGVAALHDARADLARNLQGEALSLLRSVILRAAPTLARAEPVSAIEQLLCGALAEALDEPRVVLRVSDAVFDAVQTRIAPAAQANGYAGKVVLLADAAIAAGDARVEWADGGAERDTGRLLAEIDAILTRALATDDPAPDAIQENRHG